MKRYYIFLLFILSGHLINGQICVGEAGSVHWQAWQNLFDNELGELYAEENFPVRPDVKQKIYKLQSPINYDNFLGGRISGFITVGQTDDVQFNLTGDDVTRFYLSTSESPDDLVLQAYADGYTNIEEHDKYPEQTSGLINMVAGQYYYFEMIYMEGYGGDHISLYWKTINDNPTEWRLVNGNFIADVDCLPAACPERGTPCDDGDSATSDDKEDGFCNCVGEAVPVGTCVGEREFINMYAYDSIPGGDLNDLYTHPDFPAMPDRSKTLHYLSEPFSTEVDSVGHMIQSFLTVPVTGNYRFNITGNNECIFFLSSDELIENKQAHQILVSGATDPTEHDKYIWQSTSNIYLEKGKYYYCEVNHKESSYSEHFAIFWQTPFTQADTWKRIPEFYIYDYDCEVACIPEGNMCDDGDPFTNNDQYDAYCNCVGTPCEPANCNDPIASYSSYPKCDLTDQIDNRSDVGWLSCQESASPNPLRSNSHWIMYDFGQEFVMRQSHVWNYNDAVNFDQGFEQVAIDYSLDGANWTELNLYNWNLSDGSSDYSGFIGPDFDGAVARYVLITSLDTGQPCRGFGKLLINAELCSNAGTTCDDGNPFTINDVIDPYCNCVGTNTAFNDCVVDTLSLGDTLIVMEVHSAIELVESQNTIDSAGFVMYISGDEIDLNPGFETLLGSNFEAMIELCDGSAQDEEDNDELSKKRKDIDILKVLSVPDTDRQIIQFYLEDPGQVQIEILNPKGEKVFELLNIDFINKGIYQKNLRTKKFDPGIYQVVYKSKKGTEVERLTVM
ncbi:MAG: hypothetical protein HKN51_05690 [Saprospiraceae bacterium]|nr:hypothetical protein [Bacteroidia bacterium]NNE14447.1 hypothetical protein [Saprospiraceae bacterium]